MTALSADAVRTKKEAGGIRYHGVQASTTIYKNGLCNLDNGDGYLQMADVTEADQFAGVAYEGVDNSSGADAAKSGRVYTKGRFKFAKNGTINQADLGAGCLLAVYDSDTVQKALATGTTDSGGTDNELDWTALAPHYGKDGEFTIQFVIEGADEALDLRVTPHGLIFALETSSGVIQTTADDIKDALAANAIAAAMVAAVDGDGNDGSAAVTEQTIKLTTPPVVGKLAAIDGSSVWVDIEGFCAGGGS